MELSSFKKDKKIFIIIFFCPKSKVQKRSLIISSPFSGFPFNANLWGPFQRKFFPPSFFFCLISQKKDESKAINIYCCRYYCEGRERERECVRVCECGCVCARTPCRYKRVCSCSFPFPVIGSLSCKNHFLAPSSWAKKTISIAICCCCGIKNDSLSSIITARSSTYRFLLPTLSLFHIFLFFWIIMKTDLRK